LWLNLTSLVEGAVQCWADNIKLVYNSQTNAFENNAGVEVSVPGWGTTTTMDELSGIGIAKYFQTLTDRLVSLGLQRGTTLRGAP